MVGFLAAPPLRRSILPATAVVLLVAVAGALLIGPAS
jgi:hypothetical protein